jgi:hypothetical protein
LEDASVYSRFKCFDDRLRPSYLCARNKVLPLINKDNCKFSGLRRQTGETVYRKDLMQNPSNGWALYGLRTALEAQAKQADAVAVGDDFKKAWRDADVGLSSSELRRTERGNHTLCPIVSARKLIL